MSISLPNGTILSTPSAAPVSAAVTRILHLANFSAEYVVVAMISKRLHADRHP